MTVFIRIFAVLTCLLAIAACGPQTDAPENTDLAGTKVTIKSAGKLYFITLTGLDGDTVLSEATNWKNEFLYTNRYYRGLLLVGRKESDYHWELDVDLEPLDNLYPLKPGSVAELNGSIIYHDKNEKVAYSARLEVIAERPFLLPSGSQTVYEIEIVQRYEWEDGKKEWRQIVYHAPDLSLNVKGIYTEKGEKQFWRVTDIERTDESRPNLPARPRRLRGTVMI